MKKIKGMYIPWFALLGLKLKGAELVVFSFIFSHHNQGRAMYWSNDKLASIFNYSRGQINSTLRALKNQGLICAIESDKRTIEYTINENNLNKLLPDWCNISLQTTVNKNDTCLQEKETQNSQLSGHDDNTLMIDNLMIKGDDGCPLHKVYFDNDDFRNYLVTMLSSPRWMNRPIEGLRIATAILYEHPVPVAIEMLRHTISGDYPMIYPPSPEVIELAQKRSEKKESAEPNRPNESDPNLQRQIFKVLIKMVPEDLRAAAFGPGFGQPGLRSAVNNDVITILFAGSLEGWILQNKDKIQTQLIDWANTAGIKFEKIDFHIVS